MEITIIVAFDTEINDFDTLTNLRFDIVDTIIPGVGCLISNDDIKAKELLMRIPKQSEESITDMLAEAEHERCDAAIESSDCFGIRISNSLALISSLDIKQPTLGDYSFYNVETKIC